MNDTLTQKNLTDIFRTFHPKAAEYTFFSCAYGTFFRIDHILGHKSALNKYKKTEIIPCVFSDHNTMKLEVNHKKKFKKNTNTWRLNNMLKGSTRKSKQKFKNTQKQMKTKTQWSKPLGCSKSCHKREVYSNTGLPLETRNISNK